MPTSHLLTAVILISLVLLAVAKDAPNDSGSQLGLFRGPFFISTSQPVVPRKAPRCSFWDRPSPGIWQQCSAAGRDKAFEALNNEVPGEGSSSPLVRRPFSSQFRGPSQLQPYPPHTGAPFHQHPTTDRASPVVGPHHQSPRGPRISFGSPSTGRQPSVTRFRGEGASPSANGPPFPYSSYAKGHPSASGASQDPSGPRVSQARPSAQVPGVRHLSTATAKATGYADKRAAAPKAATENNPSSSGVARASASWHVPLSARKRLGGARVAPTTASESSGLHVGMEVEAACVRVWPRYALLRLLSNGGAFRQRPRGYITGFLHCSGIKQNGCPLSHVEQRSIDLTKVMLLLVLLLLVLAMC